MPGVSHNLRMAVGCILQFFDHTGPFLLPVFFGMSSWQVFYRTAG